MNAVIQNTISQYFLAFTEKVCAKFDISQDQLDELWKETQKEKLKIKPRRRVATNKPPSAYINFCNHHRKIIKSQNPNLTFGEVAKTLGGMWKSLDADEKKKHTDPTYVGATTTSAEPHEDGKKVKRARKNKD